MGMGEAFADQLRMSYIVFRCQFSGFPNEFEHGDQACQSHPGQKDDENPANIGQTELVRLAHPVIFSLKCGQKCGQVSVRSWGQVVRNLTRQEHLSFGRSHHEAFYEIICNKLMILIGKGLLNMSILVFKSVLFCSSK